MADRMYTSKRTEEILDKLHFSTKLDFSTLARIGFCLALKHPEKITLKSEDSSGKHLNRSSFFNDDELLMKTLLYATYEKRFEDEEESTDRQSVIKDHIDQGCILLDQLFQESDQDSLCFFERMYSELSYDSKQKQTKAIAEQLRIHLGVNVVNNSNLIIELNNTRNHVNSHMAIVGKPGVGKTQFLLKILADIRKQSKFKTNYIFFDYKGEAAENKDFLSATQAVAYHPPSKPLPINPFILTEYSDSVVLLSAREKTESFASIDKKFGQVQTGNLTDFIRKGYENRKQKSLKFPDFKEIYSIAQKFYQVNEKAPDSLMGKLKDLTDFHLFWEHGDESSPIESLTSKTMVIDLSKLPVLKELVAYLVIERLYKEMVSLPESQVKNDCREIRTILVIDEAHNYLSQKNPFLEKIVREGRSKGIAVFFASQSPSDYDQSSFDFRELLEFSFIFQCDGVSSKSVQDLIACPQKMAKELQIEIAKLKKFHVISRSLVDGEDITKIEIIPFYKAFENGEYTS